MVLLKLLYQCHSCFKRSWFWNVSCYYAWSTADGAFSGETNTINATAATAGTYILTVTKTATVFDSKRLLLQKISLLINGAAVDGALVVVHPSNKI
jgi:hypothetical protein